MLELVISLRICILICRAGQITVTMGVFFTEPGKLCALRRPLELVILETWIFCELVEKEPSFVKAQTRAGLGREGSSLSSRHGI